MELHLHGIEPFSYNGRRGGFNSYYNLFNTFLEKMFNSPPTVKYLVLMLVGLVK